MAMRKFKIPGATAALDPTLTPAAAADGPGAIESQASVDTADPGRTRKKRLIGGSLDKRREFGTPSDIQGAFLLDPIFRADDEARLKAWCHPSDPRPLVVEIGFQLGEFAAAFCQERPHVRYLGFEVRRKFCEEADALLVQKGITNALLALVDAREMLPRVLEPASLDELLVFFPDPWWKQRHIKKRLLHPEFIVDAAGWIKPGGRLLLKTDVEGYAEWAEGEMRQEPRFAVTRLADPAAGLPFTLRERRCRFHGLPTYAIEARRIVDKPAGDTSLPVENS
jgi:tRNA (guanine-N(7)-)-methyltransferase